jgi:hypothetical protein
MRLDSLRQRQKDLVTEGRTLAELGEQRTPRSPRAWGWTVVVVRLVDDLDAFPTRVGMDRTPRVCGSGGMRRSPRAWGWTGPEVIVQVQRLAFPTRAGMDRWYASASGMRMSVPHARGDGPIEMVRGADGKMRSPRAWGWTEPHRRSTPPTGAFPTRVGMDRRHRLSQDRPAGVPHARGDGSSHAAGQARKHSRSPRGDGPSSGERRGDAIYSRGGSGVYCAVCVHDSAASSGRGSCS